MGHLVHVLHRVDVLSSLIPLHSTQHGIFQSVLAIGLMAGVFFLPRSQRWLAKAGRTGAAIETLARIQAHGDFDVPLVVAEWEEFTILAAGRKGQKGWRRFVRNGVWRRTFASTSIQAW